MESPTPPIDPSRSILLVCDYQPAILDRSPQADALLATAREAIGAARAAGMAVGYVRVALTAEEAAAIPPTNKGFAAAAASGGMADGDPRTDVHPAVAPMPGDIVVRKSRVGAFSTTELGRLLADRGIDTLVLAGISTGGVILSTVRDAADHDYRIYILQDACGDRDPEVHDVLMHRVFPRQAYVVTTGDLPGLFSA